MKIGSLCTGYGGLDMALDGTTAWVSDIDRHAATLLAYRFPDIPNLGDLTAVDWSSVEPVDIITAGYPCQPFSHAGKREGQNDERHIWPHIAAAVRVLRPRYVFLENVAGHLSLGFGDVLGDLAEAGYDAQWASLRASDVGACHGRNRVFILASLRHTGHDARSPKQGKQPQVSTGGTAESGRAADRNSDRRTSNGRGQTLAHVRPELNEQAATEPPRTDRPATNSERDRGGRRGDTRDVARAPGAGEADREQRQRNGHATGNSSTTPTDTEGDEQREPSVTRAGFDELSHSAQWAEYLPAVQRWADTIGRPAPRPTTTGNTGRPVLNPQFVEWMMGLPAGWVTDVPGISRTGQLHLLGNGVVPQQARAALAVMA